MGSYLFQSWFTYSDSIATNLTQPAAEWLRLPPASDLACYIEVPRLTGSPAFPKLRYETSPTRDSSQFREMASVALVQSASPVVTKIFLYGDPAVPVAEWIRWRLTTNDVGAWELSFRVTLMSFER